MLSLEFGRFNKPCFFLLCASSLIAADATAFNGHWDIRVPNEPRARVWWLGVEGAGTAAIHASFVGAPGGDVDKIPQITLENGELFWKFSDKRYSAKSNEGVYRAHLENGKLVGTLSVTGDAAGDRQFVGVRAPEIADVDDASWVKSTPIQLFDHHDLSGFRPMVPGKPIGWVVKDGTLANVAGANNLVSEQKFWNFELHAEFRLGKDSNSGIGLRDRYEVQILEDFGKPADIHGMGALYGRVKPSRNASRPPGQWQTFDVRLVGRTVTVKVNGQTVVSRARIGGLTAIAHDADEGSPGPVSIQGDHGAVEFRDLTITPLVQHRR